ncbi:MAG: hypothetical protein QG630_36 [Patescibacteria group bacterium]|nr:hypothetical protein [Patescibacteria group bacterium]
MLKKYFIFLFIFTSFLFLSNKASAVSYLATPPGVNTCTSKNINATATNIISQQDLNIGGGIDVCVVTGSNPPFTINENGSLGYFATHTISSGVGTTTVNMPYTFSAASIAGEEQITFTISDASNNTDLAQINATVPPVPIDLSNNRSLANNGTLAAGLSITFTCTNSTELYYDPIPNATNTPVVSDYTEATGYILVHQITPSIGTHTIECDNIGGSLTRETFTFNVVAANKLDINNTSYTPTTALSPVTFTWSSNGTDCGFYNYDKSVKFGNASGNAGAGFSYTLGSPNYPSGANSYGYFIKCYDTADPTIAINELNVNLSSTTEIVSGTSTTVAWYALTATFTCPSGYTPDSGNVCVANTPPSNPPICAFTDSSNQFIACSCPSGTITGLSVEDTNGDTQQIIPPGSPFAWNNLQYRYQITCSTGGGGGGGGGGGPTLIPALQRPYTHFLSFNVSAGYIKPGGVIDLNWVIQDPTTTCKIIGVDLKTGAEIFNSTAGNYSAINTSVTVSKSSSNVRNFSDGSFKALMGQALTINSSARFTASCQNNSTYMPGYYKLVRDVYTTKSQDR